MAKYNDVTIGQTEACINRMGGMQNFLRFIAGSGRIVFDSLSTILREVSLGAQSNSVVSKKYFEDVGVKWMSDHFNKQFIGLEVPFVGSADFIVREIKQSSSDAAIITELGGVVRAETSVLHFRDFLSRENGSKEYFIFYLRGKDGNLWSVYAYWRAESSGWDVDATSVSDPDEWGLNFRVVSRK